MRATIRVTGVGRPLVSFFLRLTATASGHEGRCPSVAALVHLLPLRFASRIVSSPYGLRHSPRRYAARPPAGRTEWERRGRRGESGGMWPRVSVTLFVRSLHTRRGHIIPFISHSLIAVGVVREASSFRISFRVSLTDASRVYGYERSEWEVKGLLLRLYLYL